jgi:hypothetical protein
MPYITKEMAFLESFYLQDIIRKGHLLTHQ